MPAQLISTSEGQTMVLTLSNPEHRNALGPEMYAAGVEALGAADANPEVRRIMKTRTEWIDKVRWLHKSIAR